MYPHVLLVSLLFLFATLSLARVVERLPVDSTTTLLPRADPFACTEVHPPPANASCRVTGTSSYGCNGCFQFVPALVANFQDCADLNNKHLGSRFSYNNVSSVCQLYHPEPDGPLAPIKPNPLSNTVFSDAACYQCSSGCPSVQYTYQEIDAGKALNLMSNGGFENSKTLTNFGPWQRYEPDHAGIAPSRIISPGYQSHQALQKMDERPDHIGLVIIQPTRPCDGQLYLLKYDYKFTPSPYAPFGTYIDALFDSDYRYLPSNHTAADTSWQTAEYSVQTGKNSYDFPQNAEFDLYGKIDIDNVGLYPLKTPVPKGPNIIPNGDFETGGLGPWSASIQSDSFPDSNPAPGFKVQSPGINSTYALALTLPVPKRGTIGGTGTLSQVFPMKPNTRYAFSFDYSLSPRDKYFQIFFHLYHYRGNTANHSQLTVDDSWAYGAKQSVGHYLRVFRSAGETMKVSMDLTAFGVRKYERVNSIDNISLREVK